MLWSKSLLLNMKFLPFQIKTSKMSWKRTSRWVYMPGGNSHPHILSRNLSVMFCKEKYRFTFQLCIFYIHILWPRDKWSSRLPDCPKDRCTDTTVKISPRQHLPLLTTFVFICAEWQGEHEGFCCRFFLTWVWTGPILPLAIQLTSGFVQCTGSMCWFVVWGILQCQRIEDIC